LPYDYRFNIIAFHLPLENEKWNPPQKELDL